LTGGCDIGIGSAPTIPLKMLTAGVDLASQTAHTASCTIEWSDGRATVTGLAVDVDDDTITSLISAVDKLGIDTPLGWPIAFAEAVGLHSREGSWPSTYLHADTRAMRYRRTDLWLWNRLEMSPPLSVSTDRIALPAMRAAALLARLPVPVALDGSGVVVEVYPAAALRRWELPWRKYKHKENAEARNALVEQLVARTAEWLTIPSSHVERCQADDDALDALIAALIARAAALNLVEPIPEDEQTEARREGWVAVPMRRSLDRLAVTVTPLS
jgi:predicted nuclease with RNAse H fold